MRLTYKAQDQNGKETGTVWYASTAGDSIFPKSDKEEQVLKKLAAYEDTGLTPEDIRFIRMTQLITPERLSEILRAETEGRLVLLPCKVGDTVWFYLYEDRYYLRQGIYRGTITELKSVQRLNQSPLVLAVVEYEYPDPWYGEEMNRSEMHCSFGAYGTWVQFYLTREEAETAVKNSFEKEN